MIIYPQVTFKVVCKIQEWILFRQRKNKSESKVGSKGRKDGGKEGEREIEKKWNIYYPFF